jgi:predicted nucleic acid-binding protein
MQFFIDTGILLRIADRSAPECPVIRDAIRRLRDNGVSRLTATQNMAEFWNVCTRPKTSRGGFGLSIPVTNRRRRVVQRIVQVISEPANAYDIWTDLLIAHSVSGMQVHDARLVAFMKALSVADIVTLNGADFRRYPGINVHHPADIPALFP